MLLDELVSLGAVGVLATEVQPFAVFPCRAVELEREATSHVAQSQVDAVDDIVDLLERPDARSGGIDIMLT